MKIHVCAVLSRSVRTIVSTMANVILIHSAVIVKSAFLESVVRSLNKMSGFKLAQRNWIMIVCSCKGVVKLNSSTQNDFRVCFLDITRRQRRERFLLFPFDELLISVTFGECDFDDVIKF